MPHNPHHPPRHANNRKSSSYFDPRRNKHDTPHPLEHILVILDEPVDEYHSKVAPQCVLSLFRRILVAKLLKLSLVHPDDMASPYNRLVTVYYDHQEIRPEGEFVNLRPQDVHVYPHHNRIVMVFETFGLNLMYISQQTASRICSQQYLRVFQRAVNDSMFDLKKQIYQVEGIYYAPIYYD